MASLHEGLTVQISYIEQSCFTASSLVGTLTSLFFVVFLALYMASFVPHCLCDMDYKASESEGLLLLLIVIFFVHVCSHTRWIKSFLTQRFLC